MAAITSDNVLVTKCVNNNQKLPADPMDQKSDPGGLKSGKTENPILCRDI